MPDDLVGSSALVDGYSSGHWYGVYDLQFLSFAQDIFS